MTENETISLIGADGIGELSQCFILAWDEIRGPYNHPDFCDRIRSDLLRELAAIYGQRRLPKYGFRYQFVDGQHLFFMDSLVIVFRKLDEFRQPHAPTTRRGQRLFQSKLFDLPTLIVGMLPEEHWTGYVGIFLSHPNSNAPGMAWTLNITDGIAAVDADQSKFVKLIDEAETEETHKIEKFKPRYDNNIGESSEEAGPGGSPAS